MDARDMDSLVSRTRLSSNVPPFTDFINFPSAYLDVVVKLTVKRLLGFGVGS